MSAGITQPIPGSSTEGTEHGEFVPKGLEELKSLPGDHPEFGRGRKPSPVLGTGGQRDEGVLSESKSQGCQAGVGSKKGHSLCWKCCPSEGWGRYPGSSLPPIFSPPTSASHPCVCSVIQLCPTLHNPMTVACQGPLSMAFSRQEYWSGLPCLPPGDLPDPRNEPTSPVSQREKKD